MMKQYIVLILPAHEVQAQNVRCLCKGVLFVRCCAAITSWILASEVEIGIEWLRFCVYIYGLLRGSDVLSVGSEER